MSRKPKRQSRPRMTRYPSIDGAGQDLIGLPCVAFHKYDGSNLQFKWTQSDGWCQFGTRKRTIDESNPLFGDAIPAFMANFADPILARFRQHREYRNAKSLVAFCEYFGKHTFSGLHRKKEPKQLRLFDVLILDQGFVLPEDFAQQFGDLDIAEVVYRGPLSHEFMKSVYQGEYAVSEGVVVKGVMSTQRRKGKTEQDSWMAKIKTKAWLDELARRAGTSPELKQELADNLKQQAALLGGSE